MTYPARKIESFRFDRIAARRPQRARAIAIAFRESSDWDEFYAACRAIQAFSGVDTSRPDWGPDFADIADGPEGFDLVSDEAVEWLERSAAK